MKITVDFEYPHELIDLLKVLSKNLKEDAPKCSHKFEIDTSFLNSYDSKQSTNNS